MTDGVVVTGIGVVAARSCGLEEFAATIGLGVMPCSDVSREAGYHVEGASRKAILSGGLDLSPWLGAAEARRMSLPSRLAVAASRMAIEDARVAATISGARSAVFMSTAFGAVAVTEQILRTRYAEGPEMVSPFSFTESVANVAAAQVAIAHQIQGPNVTLSQREAGALTAVGRAAVEIAAGRIDRALVGAVDEMPPVLHAFLGRLGVLARADERGEEIARPFDLNRAGFIPAEGAVVLVLEREEAAHERGVCARARLGGFGAAFDPTASRMNWGTGHVGLGASLRRMLANAGASLRDVGRIVSGASGTVDGDRLEAHTLREAWQGTSLPPILAPKAVVGEYGGGFLGAALLLAFAPEAPPGHRDVSLDPMLGVTPCPAGPIQTTGHTLVTSLASGGAAAWLLLEKA